MTKPDDVNDFFLDPPERHCLLCGNKEMTCECSSIEWVMCLDCETVLYNPGETPSWGQCECGKTLYDFIEEAPRPGRGYVLKRTDNALSSVLQE
jgi:hypothetical protein